MESETDRIVAEVVAAWNSQAKQALDRYNKARQDGGEGYIPPEVVWQEMPGHDEVD